MTHIPTQLENPKGLHQKYSIQKVVPKTEQEINDELSELQKAGSTIAWVDDFKLVPTDPRSEYFVMRLDTSGSDINHIRACRIGIHAYANAIEPHIPQLAKDLRERYPLL